MRVAITGMGIISPLGHGQQETWENLQANRSGIDILKSFDVSAYDCKYGGEVRGFDPTRHFTPKQLKHMNRCAQYGIFAARQAVEDAGIELGSIDPYRVGLCVGSSHGGLEETESYYHAVFGKAKHVTVDRDMMFRKQYGGLVRSLASVLGVRGPVVVISNACSSTIAALGRGLDYLRSGRADLIVAGGTDTIDQSLHAGFWGLKTTSPHPTSPFSTKVGVNLGEGSAFFILEPWEKAQARGARIWAELCGYATTNDAHHATAPAPHGRVIAKCVEAALDCGGVDRDEVDYINAHGTGTNGNDEAECRAMTLVFGDRARSIPISSTKGHFGHATGAAGALELYVSLLSVSHGFIPPTLNFEAPRFPSLGLDYVPNQMRPAKVRTLIKNSFGFGGFNAVAVLSTDLRNEPHPAPRAPAPKRRVVVTGVGLVTPIGIGREAVLEGLDAGRIGCRIVQRYPCDGYAARRAGMIEDFDPRRYDRRIDPRRMDRLSQYSSVAAKLCLDDAALRVKQDNREDIGVIFGVCMGTREGIDRHLSNIVLNGPDARSPMHFPYSTQNSALGQVTLTLGIQGLCSNLTMEAGAGLAALSWAFDSIRAGHGAKILAGAGDELFPTVLHQLTISGDMARDEVIDERGISRGPGYVPAEGAGFLLLESLESARERNAKILADVVGYGCAVDCTDDLTEVDQSGANMSKAIEAALEQAECTRDNIQFIFPSDRGIPCIALAERRALEQVFGPEASIRHTIRSTSHHTGWMESSSVLVNAAALFRALATNDVFRMPEGLGVYGSPEDSTPPPALRTGKRRCGLVLSVSREGIHQAVVFEHHDNQN